MKKLFQIILAVAIVGLVYVIYGEWGRGVGTKREIVKTDDTDVFGNTVTELLALHNDSMSNLVVAAYNCGHSHVQKTWQMFCNTLCYVVRGTCVIRLSP